MRFSSIIFFTFLFAGIIKSYSQDTGTLKGKVTTENDSVLTRVNVMVKGTGLGASTDNNGDFIINGIPVGHHTINVSALGFKNIAQSVDIKAEETKTIHLILEEFSTQLGEIMIKGGGFDKQRSATTVNTVSAAKIKKLGIYQPDKILEEVPGIEVSAYNQGGTASTFSMRGFGSGGHGGDVAVTIDGISLNESEGHSDGYADLNVLIPLNIAKVDVYKGPSSVLFGNFARGGALSFETRKGGEYQDIVIRGGSFETFDAQIALGQPIALNNDKKLKTNFAVQLYRTKGFMENSENSRGNLNGRLGYDVSDKTDIALTLRGHTGKWDAPGFIPGNSEVEGGDQFFKEDPYKQAVNAENDGGKKGFVSERIDINHSFNQNLRLLVYGYAVQQSFTRFQKFGLNQGGQSENRNGRNVYSAGTSLNGNNSMGSVIVDWTAGFEYYNEFTDKTSWNTINRVRQQENPTEKRRFRVQSISTFAQAEFDIVKYFKPTIGFRYDTYDGSLKLRDPGEEASNSNLNNESHWSPKLGFRSTWFRGFDFRFIATNGFTLPEGVIRYDSDIDIDPAKICQYEVGFNYDKSNWLNVDLAGYILNTSSEINEVTPGSGEFINAGKTQRRGVEVSAKVIPFSRFHFDGSFCYISIKIKNNPDKNLEGNHLNGIPATVTNLNMDYTTKLGIGLRYKFKNIGKYATGLNNAYYYGGYHVSDMEIFYDFKMKDYQRSVRIYAQVNNIFNRRYATTAFDSFGPEGGQSFAPGPGRNFMVGVNYNL